MIGTNTIATQNMISSVSSLEVESQTVSALARSAEDGITNGKRVNPVIRMIDAIVSELTTNASPGLPTFAIKLASKGRTNEVATSSHNIG